MIGLCQDGKNSPAALRTIAGVNSFLSLRRMCGLLNRGSFLIEEPDFHDRSLSRGQKLSRRASEERGCKFFLIPSSRVWASQPWFLLDRRTRLPLSVFVQRAISLPTCFG